MKAKLSYSLAALLVFASALLGAAALASSLFSAGSDFPPFLTRLSGVLGSLLPGAAWALPGILLLIGVFLLMSGSNSAFRPVLLFILLLSLSAAVFLHLVSEDGSQALIRLIPRDYTSRQAAAAVLGVIILELAALALWVRRLQRRSRRSEEDVKTLRSGSRRGKKAGKGAGEPAAVPHPAYRPNEGEHVVEAGEDLFTVSHGENSDDDALEVFEDPSNLTLTFPRIPELPKMNRIGRTKDRIQQEMEFEQAPAAEEHAQQVSSPDDARKTARSPVPAAGEPGAEAPRSAVVKEHPEQQGEGEEQVIQQEPAEEAPGSEDEFVPGVIGLSSRTADEQPESRSTFTLHRGGYLQPPDDLLVDYPDISSIIDEHTRKAGEVLMQTLREFKIEAALTGVQKGPVVTMFEIMPAPGIRVQTITNLADNIALQLAASRVRIVAPIPGKQAVGIEIPNRKRSIVGFKEMLAEMDRYTDYAVPMVLGTDITGEKQIIDLVKTPHLLIAGATGSGKSVCVNSLICSILFRRSPKEVRIIMVDPKIVELKLYNHIPHLLTPVITEPKKALKALQYCILEMERRYSLLDSLNVRDLPSYNRKAAAMQYARERLPNIVVIIDEFADLMTTTGKELEGYLARLAAMARAVGIHLVLATQRPSTNVITGIIKANIPSRIAFMVTSNTDSRIIIDQPGAEKLLGRGDMLFSSSWDPIPSRIQGAFLTEEEVERVVAHVKAQGEPDYLDEEYFRDDDEDDEYEGNESDDSDDLMQEALKIVSQRGSASASYLQRRLKIGYNRAARLVEEMEERGIVGPAQGSKPREVIRMPGLE